MNVFGNGRSGFDLNALLKFNDISEKTRSHLTKVYSLLMVCCFVCAFGMYINSAFIASGFFMNLLSIILSVYLIYQVMNRANSEDTRMLFLGGLAFQMGFLVGPAMHLLMEHQPQIVF